MKDCMFSSRHGRIASPTGRQRAASTDDTTREARKSEATDQRGAGKTAMGSGELHSAAFVCRKKKAAFYTTSSSSRAHEPAANWFRSPRTANKRGGIVQDSMYTAHLLHLVYIPRVQQAIGWPSTTAGAVSPVGPFSPFFLLNPPPYPDAVDRDADEPQPPEEHE